MDNLHVRISEELKKEVFDYAGKHGLTFSDVVRKSLSMFLVANGYGKPFKRDF